VSEHAPAGPRTLVVALGGNAMLRRGDDGSIGTQIARADAAMAHVARLAAAGHRLAVTHGNGPVVGNIVLRNEAARASVTPMPLYIADADSEGGLGLMLQLSLENALASAGVDRPVATIVTETIVEADDPAFGRPTKPIGPYYEDGSMAALKEAEPDWAFMDVPGRGWRRVVPSPRPISIVQHDVIARLVAAGTVTIAAGGGGVPVVAGPDGRRAGVDAVIDKDWASALLALEIGADALLVAMEADRVYLGWGTERPEPIDRLTLEAANDLLASGAFEEGGIAPKVAASAWFAAATGRPAVVCRADDLEDALAGRAGTRIVG
jgi:carbamate kinase